MQIDVTPKLLDEVNAFISDKDLITLMNDKGLSVPAMGFVLQMLINAIDDMTQLLDEDENM